MALHKHFLLQSTFDHPQKCTIAKWQIAHLGLICAPKHGGTLTEGSWGRFLSPSVLSGNRDLLLSLPGWWQTCGVWPCMAFLCCLGRFAQTPSTPWSCSTVRHPNWDGNFMGDSPGSAQHWIKGRLELGRSQCREGKNRRRRKGSLVSYEEAGLRQQCPCRAADRNKRGESNSCTDKMAGRNLSPQLNYRWALAFLIPSLPAWDMFLHLLDPCPKLACSPPISFSYSILLFLLKRHQNTWDILGAGATQIWWHKSVSPVCSLFLS